MKPYHWAGPGDINAFFGLALDNIANLVLTVALLSAGFGFPANFALRYMIPGTALGVLVGDLWFTWIAYRCIQRTGRHVTAMPLGLDTPSTIGMVLFVLGPSFLDARNRGLGIQEAAIFSWQIGMAAIVASGLFKLACAPTSGWIRRSLPRAGLLGSLTAIALVLISFLPLLEILHVPMVGLVSLAIVLGTLVAHLRLPLRVPGAVGALAVALAGYYTLVYLGVVKPHAVDAPRWPLVLNIPWPTLGWLAGLPESLRYLPIVLPFALATVVGGIDCTESAAAAGDEYDTRQVIAVEAVATLVAGCCGGVIQTTPYIGHPAYKLMGGRAAYTLAAALFVGGAGICGYFSSLYALIPKAAIFPILVFVGLEITSQSFRATPKRHYPAVALACVPALAYLVMMFVEPLLDAEGLARLSDPSREHIQTMRVLGSGFILTSLIWSSALAALIDHHLRLAALLCFASGLFTLFGAMHSPLPGGPLFLPWDLPDVAQLSQTLGPIQLAIAYATVGVVFLIWSLDPNARRRIAHPDKTSAIEIATPTDTIDPDGI